MIVGNGMLATAFAPFHDRSDVVVFASGVANSAETSLEQFERERLLLQSVLSRTQSETPEALFVYIGTCSVHDNDSAASAYVQHKRRMEELVQASYANHLVIRMPQVVGPSRNRTTLVNYLFDRIRNDEPFTVWRHAVRYLIDIEDAIRIAQRLIECVPPRSRLVHIVPRPCLATEIVAALESVCGRRAKYTLVDKGAQYDLESAARGSIADNLDVAFDDNYLQRMIAKYYSVR